VTLKADEYRAKARECEVLAQQMRGSLKQQLIEIAGKWRTMAAYEEKHSRSFLGGLSRQQHRL
jgi:hypothetical protein